eukprot:CAMPEP_0180389204 /NCGR_PEP_ID=MMETSP0989-20121125/31273_1 /TAXON_ID=697907 /ORGANISM="non described non described, Strain CCMP2293" /LENGTH=115 /DNA_ID=CAMNT_0022390369 /DNA_START=110 /DNA_END=453 /DNA_ORIENTATION=-
MSSAAALRGAAASAASHATRASGSAPRVTCTAARLTRSMERAAAAAVARSSWMALTEEVQGRRAPTGAWRSKSCSIEGGSSANGSSIRTAWSGRWRSERASAAYMAAANLKWGGA